PCRTRYPRDRLGLVRASRQESIYGQVRAARVFRPGHRTSVHTSARPASRAAPKNAARRRRNEKARSSRSVRRQRPKYFSHSRGRREKPLREMRGCSIRPTPLPRLECLMKVPSSSKPLQRLPFFLPNAELLQTVLQAFSYIPCESHPRDAHDHSPEPKRRKPEHSQKCDASQS